MEIGTMKIAYLFDQVMPGKGADHMQLMNTMSALTRLGCEVTLFLPASNTDELPTAESLCAYYHVEGHFKVDFIHSIFPGPRIPEKVIHPLLCAALLGKKLRSFDLVYSRNIPAIAAGLCVGVPTMYDTYRPWPAQYAAMAPLFRLFFMDRHFMGIALHSEYARRAYMAKGFAEEKLLTAHNGFEKRYYTPALSRLEARRATGLPEDRKIALYAGRIAMAKGLDHLLALAEARPDVEFVFVGDGDSAGDFSRAAAKLPNCRLCGWQSEESLPKYLFAADVLMIPPTAGPLKKVGNTVLPIKLFSYIAAGRAIYAPIAPDTAELLEHNRNAYLVQPDDAQAELAGFNALIDDDAMMERLGSAAGKDAENLTWESRAQKIYAFMERRLKEIRESNSK